MCAPATSSTSSAPAPPSSPSSTRACLTRKLLITIWPRAHLLQMAALAARPAFMLTSSRSWGRPGSWPCSSPTTSSTQLIQAWNMGTALMETSTWPSASDGASTSTLRPGPRLEAACWSAARTATSTSNSAAPLRVGNRQPLLPQGAAPAPLLPAELHVSASCTSCASSAAASATSCSPCSQSLCSSWLTTWSIISLPHCRNVSAPRPGPGPGPCSRAALHCLYCSCHVPSALSRSKYSRHWDSSETKTPKCSAAEAAAVASTAAAAAPTTSPPPPPCSSMHSWAAAAAAAVAALCCRPSMYSAADAWKSAGMTCSNRWCAASAVVLSPSDSSHDSATACSSASEYTQGSGSRAPAACCCWS
mmetsp:Transcript_33440/g.73945  ORF Transcript_33440/g.73945 Transcript_33440/m.73945 type:complete len:362 (-) Transcript_33440:2424-3509(-)